MAPPAPKIPTSPAPPAPRGSRSVRRIVPGLVVPEGEGMSVRRAFPTAGLVDVDPFLLFDHMGPAELPPGFAHGFPDHPHRGFETVTYVLAGRFEHRDSHGHAGTIGPGDVQWMTAGAGLVHSEMPEGGFARAGGRLEGFQLWVNLPRRDKMMRPRYQEVPAARIPVGRSADGKVSARVIAGEALGASAVIETRTPIAYLHFTLAPGARVAQPVPADWSAFAYVVEGEGRFGRDVRQAGRWQVVQFAGDGDTAEFAAPEDATSPLSVLFIAGRPLDEPVVRYGPFVMNTEDEIAQAIADFRAGRMGRIPAMT